MAKMGAQAVVGDKVLCASKGPLTTLSLLCWEHAASPGSPSLSQVLTLNEGLEFEQGYPFCTGYHTHVQG